MVFRRRQVFRRRRPLRRTTRFKKRTLRRPRKKLSKISKIRAIKRREIKNIVDTTNPTNASTLYGSCEGTNSNTGFAYVSVIGQAWDNIDLAKIAKAFSGETTVRKAVFGGFQGKYTIKNCTNGDLEMDLYWCVARRDMDNNVCPTNSWTNTVTVDYSDLRSVLDDGYKEMTGVEGNLASWVLGVTPFQIPRFCSLFKIIKTKKLLLAGGGAKRIKMNIKRKFMLPTNLINGYVQGSAGESYNVFKGITVSILAITRGEPCVTGSLGTPVTSTTAPMFSLLGEESMVAYPTSGTYGILVPPTALPTQSDQSVYPKYLQVATAYAQAVPA